MSETIEAATMRRVFRRTPLIFAMMFFNYLDRINIGFAALQMNKQLGFNPAVFGFAGSIFFFGYMLLEVPSNLLLQAPGVPPANCIPELRRCVEQLGFVGCNLNPDPSGGYWTDPPLADRWWYPFYEAMVDLNVPAMIHVSSSCNPNFHGTGAHYINGDTSAFMQLLAADLFADFPTLRFVIPHGGGAVPYHWGRYRGLAQDMNKPLLRDHLLNNVFFDTCVYHQPGAELLAKVIPVRNILFASETIGAVQGIDPETGYHYDDTKRYIDAVPWLTADDRRMIYQDNALAVYPLLSAQIGRQSATQGAHAA